MKLFIEEHFDLNILALHLELGSAKTNREQSDRKTPLISAVLYKSLHWQVLANYDTIVKVPFCK